MTFAAAFKLIFGKTRPLIYNAVYMTDSRRSGYGGCSGCVLRHSTTSNGSAYLTNEVRAYAATGEQVHYDNYWNEINNLKNRDQGVAAMQEIGITQEEQAMIDQMSSLSNQLVPLEEQAMENVQAGRLQEAVDYVYGPDYTSSITQINALKEQFLTTLDSRTMEDIQGLNLRSTDHQSTDLSGPAPGGSDSALCHDRGPETGAESGP